MFVWANTTLTPAYRTGVNLSAGILILIDDSYIGNFAAFGHFVWHVVIGFKILHV